MEIWKDIPGFEGRYEISTLGNIRSKPRMVNNHTGQYLSKQRILKQRPDYRGYMRVDIKDNSGSK